MSSTTFVIADDASFIRMLLKNMLGEEPDFKVLGEAGNGLEAIELAKKYKPDIMTIDITMPELDGLEAIPSILEVSPTTKIIVISAINQQEIILKALRRGAKDFITKPFDKNRVFSTIRNVIKEQAKYVY